MASRSFISFAIFILHDTYYIFTVIQIGPGHTVLGQTSWWKSSFCHCRNQSHKFEKLLKLMKSSILSSFASNMLGSCWLIGLIWSISISSHTFSVSSKRAVEKAILASLWKLEFWSWFSRRSTGFLLVIWPLSVLTIDSCSPVISREISWTISFGWVLNRATL